MMEWILLQGGVMNPITVRPLKVKDQSWLPQFIARQWGEDRIIAHGEVYIPSHLPGFVAEQKTDFVGLATYQIGAGACEVVTLDSQLPRQGIGRALLQAVRAAAIEQGCRRLWLVTTNDNLDALAFYQKCGLRIVAVHPGAVDAARRLKPSIPLMNENGLPLHDELELEEILPG
jgi:GNAT superfamily N-acetyltransferase